MNPSDVIECSPEIQGGVPVFRGTRVPVGTLLDSLIAGDKLTDFPTVNRAQANAALRLAKEMIAGTAATG
jgi:uncharacterized protein (DUF433 family)